MKQSRLTDNSNGFVKYRLEPELRESGAFKVLGCLDFISHGYPLDRRGSLDEDMAF